MKSEQTYSLLSGVGTLNPSAEAIEYHCRKFCEMRGENPDEQTLIIEPYSNSWTGARWNRYKLMIECVLCTALIPPPASLQDPNVSGIAIRSTENYGGSGG